MMPATKFEDLPLADRSDSWDADAAEQSVRRWASSDGSGDRSTIDWARYRRAFFWYDPERADQLGGYKLGFARVRDGRLEAVPQGVFAAAAAVRGSRGGVDIPSDDVPDVKRHIERYYEKLEMTPPWGKVGQPALQTKTFKGGRIEDEAEGVVVAVFSTFGVVDHDGDIVEPGAIKPGPVRVSAYGHASWAGALPVGRGEIFTDNEKAWAEMRFFLDTTHGRDTFNTVRGMGDLQEWSYNLANIKASYEVIDDRTVRRIHSVEVHEISPVLVGASIGTHTVAIKSNLTLSAHIDAVLADVVALKQRVAEVVALRQRKGGRISQNSRERLEALAAELDSIRSLVVAEPGTEQAEAVEELRREYLRYLALTST